MVSEIFSISFMDNLKIVFVGLIIYAIIYSMLKKIDIFPSDKIGALVAFLAAVIVSLTGIVTYIIAYALNWFVILFFILFLLLVLLLFLGVKFTDVTSSVMENKKAIVIGFFILFSVILVKGFFGVNNQFDLNNQNSEDYDPYTVDTSAPENIAGTKNSITDIFKKIDLTSDMAQASIFLLIVGIFVFLIGRE